MPYKNFRNDCCCDDSGGSGGQGAQGAQGPQGDTGTQGNTGAQGAQGAGAQGAQGNTGAQGAQGAQGAGAQGAQGAGGAGAQGAQGAQGATGVFGEFTPNGTISFWSDGNDVYGSATSRSVPYLNAVNTNVARAIPGMPILPHGMGAYYNVFGGSIGPIIQAGRPYGYGEYMAHDGNIIGVGINLWQPPNTGSHKIYVCNYTTASAALPAVGRYYNFGSSTAIGAGAYGSISHNTSYTGPFGTSAGIGATSGSQFLPIAFSPGDYIGIFVDGGIVGLAGVDIAIEGTLYLQLK